MNITYKIASQLGGEFERIIIENKEIQIYSYTSGYSWRDGRKENTRTIEEYDLSEDELFSTLKDHLCKPIKQVSKDIEPSHIKRIFKRKNNIPGFMG